MFNNCVSYLRNFSLLWSHEDCPSSKSILACLCYLVCDLAVTVLLNGLRWASIFILLSHGYPIVPTPLLQSPFLTDLCMLLPSWKIRCLYMCKYEPKSFHWSHCLYMMVNFTCQLDWSMGWRLLGQTLFWVFLWGCSCMWLTFKLIDWVKQIILPNVCRFHAISRRPE